MSFPATSGVRTERRPLLILAVLPAALTSRRGTVPHCRLTSLGQAHTPPAPGEYARAFAPLRDRGGAPPNTTSTRSSWERGRRSKGNRGVEPGRLSGTVLGRRCSWSWSNPSALAVDEVPEDLPYTSRTVPLPNLGGVFRHPLTSPLRTRATVVFGRDSRRGAPRPPYPRVARPAPRLCVTSDLFAFRPRPPSPIH